jgi:type VI secretion system protein ImpA
METSTDIEQLLLPISEESPAGEDLCYSGAYDAIKSARHADDPLARGEWQTEVKAADWKLTAHLCREALMHRTKDLKIAAWLTEALVHLEGYGGLASGLRLLQNLMEAFWETLYPGMEDGDLDYRAAALTFLNEKLPEAVYAVAVCDPAATKGYSYYDWEESRSVGFNQNLEKEQKDHRRMLIAEGKISGEAFSAAVAAGSTGFYNQSKEQLEHCRQNLADLDDFVTATFSGDPPGFTRLSEAIAACYHLVHKIHSEKQKNAIAPLEDRPATAVNRQCVPVLMESAEPLETETEDRLFTRRHAVSDVSPAESAMWTQVTAQLRQGDLKSALDRLLAAASLAPSVREKNRFLLLTARLCLLANRADLARPIVEKLYTFIETLQLEQWEHPAWIAEVIETLYRCLAENDERETERARHLFEHLCTLNATKAAALGTAQHHPPINRTG